MFKSRAARYKAGGPEYRVRITGVHCMCGDAKLVNEKGGQKI